MSAVVFIAAALCVLVTAALLGGWIGAGLIWLVALPLAIAGLVSA